MKFYKRLPINRKDPMSGRFAVEADDRIITTTTRGMQMPSGTALERTTVPVDGEIRYNKDIGAGGELEAYINGTWEIIKTNRPATVTQQEFDNGDYEVNNTLLKHWELMKLISEARTTFTV